MTGSFVLVAGITLENTDFVVVPSETLIDAATIEAVGVLEPIVPRNLKKPVPGVSVTALVPVTLKVV